MDSNASQPTDVLVELRSKFPPELVEHIFSFTTSIHASAATFFRLATEPPLFSKTISINSTKQNHLEYAFITGDLPLLKWILTHSTEIYHDLNWNFLVAKTHLSDDNIHVYLYAFTLLDVNNPLLANTDARNHLPLLHDNLRAFATQHERIYVLELLHRSNLAAKDGASFLDSSLVISTKNMKLLEYARKHKLFKPKDQFLQSALSGAWVNGLIYLLDTCGLRFLTWNNKDYPYLTPSNAVAMQLHDLNIFPDDTCSKCFEHWFSRFGYWGTVAVYKRHKLNAECYFTNLSAGNTPLLQYALDDAILTRDLNKIEYMSLPTFFLKPTFNALKKTIKNNDVELLRFLYTKFGRRVEDQIKKKWIQKSLVDYMNDKTVENASLQPMMQFLDSIRPTKGELITRQFIKEAMKKSDIELVKWVLGHSSYRFNEREVNIWKKSAKERGCKEIENILNEYHDNFKTSHPKEEDMAVVAIFL